MIAPANGRPTVTPLSLTSEGVELFDTSGIRKRILLLVILLLLVAWRVPGAVRGVMPPQDLPMDFFQEWASARNLLAGRPVYESQRVTQQLYLGLDEAATRKILIEVNAHPPTSVVLALPLAGLPYPMAMLLWNLMSLALFAYSVWLVLTHLGVKLSGWSWVPLAALLLVSNPFRQQVNQGQLNCVLLALLTASWLYYRRGHSMVSAALIGLATAVKIFPGFLMFWFVARREWHALLAGGLALGATLVVTAMVLGLDACLYYVHDVIPHVGEWRSAWINASLPGFFAKLFWPRSLGGQTLPILWSWEVAVAGTAIGVLLVSMAVWHQSSWANTQESVDLAFGLTTVAMLLVSPITWDHYYVLLLLPATLLWLGARQRATCALLTLVFATLWIGPDWFWYALIGTRWFEPLVARPWQTLTALSFQFYALAALFVINFVVLEGKRMHH